MIFRDVFENASVASAIIAVAILLRLCIGLHGYSGQGVSPQYGDYEAQRHWMELTVNLPIKDWYRETNDNSLGYWGIDYPPLSAYQSWLCGKIIGWLEPEAMELHSSRGYETLSSKLWMRLSVITFDLAVFMPGVMAALYSLKKDGEKLGWWPLAASLLQPVALLVDHGHFQYNNIGLGLTAGAAAAVMSDRPLTGSFLFCLALNHKQMALYYAPAFFAHLLGRCLQRPHIKAKVWAVSKLAFVVVATFAVVWWPWLGSKEEFLGVLQRLAPLRRGLFEDYVANFWCVSSLVIKWKRLCSQQALVRMTTALTVLAFVPCLLHQVRRPSRLGFVYCLANSAFAFFMFSYQVHEKSVLLPLMPLLLLANEESFLAAWLPTVASFSMFPLLRKDGDGLAYAAAMLFWFAVSDAKKLQLPVSLRSWRCYAWSFVAVTAVAGVLLQIIAENSHPPVRLPFLFDAMFVSLAFLHLFIAALYLNVRQLQM